ncbi:MAG: hypothetical protein CVV54_04220 [Synergistetes bacterium HGW-Synergistetes-1]|nr:MAG: hypothetical protein CVV54_04220 [Synergistetes bacterium HGW-Synergistetes-1]
MANNINYIQKLLDRVGLHQTEDKGCYIAPPLSLFLRIRNPGSTHYFHSRVTSDPVIFYVPEHIMPEPSVDYSLLSHMKKAGLDFMSGCYVLFPATGINAFYVGSSEIKAAKSDKADPCSIYSEILKIRDINNKNNPVRKFVQKNKIFRSYEAAEWIRSCNIMVIPLLKCSSQDRIPVCQAFTKYLQYVYSDMMPLE